MKHRTILALVLLLGLLAPFTPTTAAAQDGPAVVTVAQPGDPTVDVAVAFSQLAFPDDDAAEGVLIGRDDLFADSLTAGQLQGDDTPLLLTPADGLPDEVAQEIQRLGATRATVLGGTNAVGTDVEADLEALDLDVERIEGPTRLETATAVAGQVQTDTVVLARAFPATEPTQAFADALAAGALAAAEGHAIVLTQTDVLSAPTAAQLQAGSYDRVVVVGGTAAISDAVLSEIPEGAQVDRIAGDTRFATATEIATERGHTGPADVDTVVLLDGQDADGWAAGFAAATYSAAHEAPILLSAGDELPPATEQWLTGVTFAQGPVRTLVCAATEAACTAAAELLGLGTSPVSFPDLAEGQVVHQETPVEALVDPDAEEVTIEGDCLAVGGTTEVPANGLVLDRIAGVEDPTPAPAGDCLIEWTLAYPDGQQVAGDLTVEVVLEEVTFPSLDAVVAEIFAGTASDPGADLRIGSFCFDGVEVEPTLGGDGSFTVPVTEDAADAGIRCEGQWELTFPDGGRQVGDFIPTLRCPTGHVAWWDPDNDIVAVTDAQGENPQEVSYDGASITIDGASVSRLPFEDALDVGDCLGVDGNTIALWNASHICPPFGSLSTVYAFTFDSQTQDGQYVRMEGSVPNTYQFSAGEMFSVAGQAVDVLGFVDAFQPGDCLTDPGFDPADHQLWSRAVEFKAFRF